MKQYIVMLGVVLLSAACYAGDESEPSQTMTVDKVVGAVSVRHGVAEQWSPVKNGDVLRPHDTMKTGKGASAMVLVWTEGNGVPAKRKDLSLPGEVMIDMSDVRNLSQEELMLKLTMERVRASSYQWKNDELNIPSTTVMHGPDMSPSRPLNENNAEQGILEMNGSRVLYDNGFYSTCALKTMEVLRRYPTLAAVFNNRLLVAQALEKADLSGEALNEYVAISDLQNLDAQQRESVRAKISALKKRSHQQ